MVMEATEHKPVAQLRVADVMTSPATTIEAGASLWDAVERFFLTGLHHLVVVDDDRCVGLLDDRQVAAQWPARATGLRSRRVDEAIDARQPRASADARVLDAAQTMLSHRAYALPVVDDERRVVGVLTASDLIKLLVATAEAALPKP
jgi:CBS domain-containing protein